MDAAGWVALIIAPGLAFVGIIVGKAMEAKSAKRDTALTMIGVLGDRLDTEKHRAEVMEDYAIDLRRVLIDSGTDVPAWPPEEPP